MSRRRWTKIEGDVARLVRSLRVGWLVSHLG